MIKCSKRRTGIHGTKLEKEGLIEKMSLDIEIIIITATVC